MPSGDMCHTLPPLVAKVEAGYYSRVYQVWIDEEHPESSTCDSPYSAFEEFNDYTEEKPSPVIFLPRPVFSSLWLETTGVSRSQTQMSRPTVVFSESTMLYPKFHFRFRHEVVCSFGTPAIGLVLPSCIILTLN